MTMEKFIQLGNNKGLCPNCQGHDTHAIHSGSGNVKFLVCENCGGIPGFCSVLGRKYTTYDIQEATYDCPHCGKGAASTQTHVVAWY